ncbi:hypothetical protein RB195_014856 [Necator americanus]|uniref:Methyltransferase FkbM domain-containing protein n=1 Tax=Necator americanus TaxID=51031 RepID=A0ABR1E1W6_NECAM
MFIFSIHDRSNSALNFDNESDLTLPRKIYSGLKPFLWKMCTMNPTLMMWIFAVLILAGIVMNGLESEWENLESASNSLYADRYRIKRDRSEDVELKVQNAYNLWHKCMMHVLEPLLFDSSKLWYALRKTVRKCYGLTPLVAIKYSNVMNTEDRKFFILSSTNNTAWNVITLGVGRDILAEKKLKRLLPKGSLFYGADPIYKENDELYPTVGKFFPIAVGNETVYGEADVLSHGSGRYRILPVVHLDIVSFLKKIVKTQFVDLLLMDNEGPEYDIIPMMSSGKEFDQNRIVVCQISAELHVGRKHLGKNQRFAPLIREILRDRRFALLTDVGFTHHRTFLINFANKNCVEKYIAQFFKSR